MLKSGWKMVICYLRYSNIFVNCIVNDLKQINSGVPVLDTKKKKKKKKTY